MKYFFCYSEPLMKFLKINNQRYITGARHIDTNKMFWLYESSIRLNELIDIYKQQK